MFSLIEMKDTIRTPPAMFGMNLLTAVTQQLRLKYANKVIIDVGLCIELFEITKLDDSHLLPGDGASYTTVFFSYVVFHPFINEILVGKIKNCSPEGLHVSLGFFDDILIPYDYLQQPSRFDEAEQLWVWEYTNVENGEKHDLYMDQDEQIRFRVIEEKFADTSPNSPLFVENTDSDEETRVPFSIVGSIRDSGLGLLSWWS